jgi:hypothetical protein
MARWQTAAGRIQNGGALSERTTKIKRAGIETRVKELEKLTRF